MMARLIAVGILSDESRHVGRHIRSLKGRLNGEEGVEFRHHAFFRAEAGLKPLHIVGNKPCILPGVSLAIVVGPVRGIELIEGFAPVALAVLAAHESRRGVEIVAVGMAALGEVSVVGGVSHGE